jgi:hypothetical protein
MGVTQPTHAPCVSFPTRGEDTWGNEAWREREQVPLIRGFKGPFQVSVAPIGSPVAAPPQMVFGNQASEPHR